MLKIQETVKEIHSHHVTNLYTVPSIYYVLAKIPGIENYFETINDFVSGGYKLSELISNNFYKNTKKKIREGYGLTECSPACTVNYQDRENRIDSVGQPFPSCDVKIFDDNGKECNTDEVGEICVKGDSVFKGYFNCEEQTKVAIKNGFLHTGDYGKIDADGYVYFCGLKKNMINVAGLNVYPKELERYIYKFEKVNEVKIESNSSILQGQTVKAYVRLSDNSKKTQEEFKTWCNENIKNSILPKIWEFE
jgi:long-chain acyl-CoA synthetase